MKDEENRRKHGLPLAIGVLLFEGDFIEEEDVRSAYGETRFVATGPIDAFGGRLHVVGTHGAMAFAASFM